MDILSAAAGFAACYTFASIVYFAATVRNGALDEWRDELACGTAMAAGCHAINSFCWPILFRRAVDMAA